MQQRTRTFLVTAALLFSPAPSLFAQGAVPSGHWAGAVTAPGMPVAVGFDMATNPDGTFSGTFDNPASHINGLPLAKIVVEGRSVILVLKAGDGTSTFTGTLSEDGKTIAGSRVDFGQRGSA